MKNSGGNVFLFVHCQFIEFAATEGEIIILGYFNVWELLSGYRFVLFVVKVPEVFEA